MGEPNPAGVGFEVLAFSNVGESVGFLSSDVVGWSVTGLRVVRVTGGRIDSSVGLCDVGEPLPAGVGFKVFSLSTVGESVGFLSSTEVGWSVTGLRVVRTSGGRILSSVGLCVGTWK